MNTSLVLANVLAKRELPPMPLLTVAEFEARIAAWEQGGRK